MPTTKPTGSLRTLGVLHGVSEVWPRSRLAPMLCSRKMLSLVPWKVKSSLTPLNSVLIILVTKFHNQLVQMSDKLTKKMSEGKMYPLGIRMHQRPVTYIKFNRDGTLFFTCSNDGTVRQSKIGQYSLCSDWPTSQLFCYSYK